MIEFWATFLASGVFSGLIATSVTLYFQNRIASKQRRLDCLRRVAGYRSMPPKHAWLEAMNEICITFNNSEAVMAALAKFERDIRATGGHKNELLVDLIKSMMADLNLSRVNIDDDFLLRPFSSPSVR
jgi:translation initiation factor 2 alpha subunit (eIF-2alpha)